jgi:hypothetical protein
MNNFQRSVLIIIACIPLIPLAAHAADKEATHWSASLGGQGDDESSWLVDGSIAYLPNQSNRFALDIAHGSTSSDVYNIASDSLGLSYGYETDIGGVSIAGRWYDDADVLNAKEATAVFQFRGEAWHVQVKGQYRQTNFDPFRANSNLRRRDGSIVAVSAVATCDVENSGYGGEVGFDGDVVQLYVGSMQYDYRETQCSFDRPGLGVLGSTNSAEFSQLATSVLNRLTQLAVSQLHTENSFLSSDITAGVGFLIGDVQLGVDYQHAREKFIDVDFNTYTVSANFLVLSNSDLTIHAGAIETESLGSTLFAGVTFTTRW